MAIDLMTSKGEFPVIVGDEDDMQSVVGVSWPSPENQAGLRLKDDDGRTTIFPMPFNAPPVFRHVDYAILAAIDKDQHLVYAHVIDRDSSICQHLDKADMKLMLEMICSGEDPNICYIM